MMLRRAAWLWITTSLLAGACAEREPGGTPPPMPIPDAGTEPDANWREAEACAGGEVSLETLGEAECSLYQGVFSRCSGESSECPWALDEADCRARSCEWLAAPRCFGKTWCTQLLSPLECERLPGCEVVERRGECQGAGVPCSLLPTEEHCASRMTCSWDAQRAACTGEVAWTCEELELFYCENTQGCGVRWQEPRDGVSGVFRPDVCRSANDCEAGERCTQRGLCEPKLGEDAACTSDAACASGTCRVRYDAPSYEPTRVCAPASDCTLAGCGYCRTIGGTPTCFDACDAADKPCSLCGCAAADDTFCDATSTCVPKLALTSPCSDDGACASGRCALPSSDATQKVCLARGGAACTGEGDCEDCRMNVCLARCSEADHCDADAGYRCVNLGDGAGTCLSGCSGQSCSAPVEGMCRGKESLTSPGEFVLVCVP